MYGYVFDDIHVQNLGQTLKFLLKENLYGHPLAGPPWESQFEEVLLELGWAKVPCWKRESCLSVTRIVLVGMRG